jgi:hypothetical protein
MNSGLLADHDAVCRERSRYGRPAETLVAFDVSNASMLKNGSPFLTSRFCGPLNAAAFKRKLYPEPYTMEKSVRLKFDETLS